MTLLHQSSYLGITGGVCGRRRIKERMSLVLDRPSSTIHHPLGDTLPTCGDYPAPHTKAARPHFPFHWSETLGEDDVAPGYLLSDCIFDGSMTSSRTTIKTKKNRTASFVVLGDESRRLRVSSPESGGAQTNLFVRISSILRWAAHTYLGAQKHLACIIKADDEGSNRTPPLLLPLAEHLLKREDTLQDGVRFGELGAVTSDLPNTVSAACSGKANTATQSWAARERAWHLCTNTDVYCTEDRSIANQGLRTVPNGTFHYEEQVVKI
ncbi:hypothetical protein Bbelb_437940 [Branchiostoma belcheri]|nr:hypothetical protein Bbelb_437940 [Branchiostoma belcheri]